MSALREDREPRTAGEPTSTEWIIVRAGVCLMVCLAALTNNADPDLWGHVRFGLDILRDRGLTSLDPYSFTSDLPWVNHEWLSELMMGIAFESGGTIGLAVLKALMVIPALCGLWLLTARAALWVRLGAFGLAWWASLPVLTTLRPQLWSVLAFVLLMWSLRTRPAWVPGIFVFWVNSHGGWLVGLGAYAVWAAHEIWHTRRWMYWGVLTIATIAATLVSPYGIELWQFLARTVRLGRHGIQEWQPLWTAPVIVWIPWMSSVAFVAVAIWRRWVSLPIAIGLVGLAYGSASVLRLVPFFVMLAAVWAIPATRIPAPRVNRFDAIAVAFVALTVVSMLTGRASCFDSESDWAPDRQAASALSGRTGTLATAFGWGQYAIWHWGPGLKVSLDGRRETVYTDELVALQLALPKGDPVAVAWLRALRPDYIWYPSDYVVVREMLETDGYRVDVETARSFIAVRADLPPLTAMRPPLTACFP